MITSNMVEPRHLDAAGAAAAFEPRAFERRTHTLSAAPTDAESAVLTTLRTYAALGGVVTGDQLAAMLRLKEGQPVSVIARWIVNDEALSFQALSHTLLPLFQFDLERGALRPGVREVLREWAGALDEWELADWFVRANALLDGRAPARALLEGDVDAVREAARADRFIVV